MPLIGFVAAAAIACGAPQGPHIRFAQATADQIKQAKATGDVIWYDFEPGDEVPLLQGIVGVAESSVAPPVAWKTKRPFSIVVFPSGQMMFSFDGKTLVSSQFASRWVLGLDAAEGGGGRGVLLIYIGRPEDIPPEIRGR